MSFRVKGSTKQHAYHRPRMPGGAIVVDPVVGVPEEGGASSSATAGASGPGPGPSPGPAPTTSALYSAVVERPLTAVWDSCAALERWARPEAIAVLLMSYLFIGLPLMVAHWL